MSEVSLQLNDRMEDVLQSAIEFGSWADGLKLSIDAQFKSFEEQMVQLISDNNFLMNRLTPLINMEKAALEGQSVTGVLVAESELEALKKEVQQHAQQLWSYATEMFELHLGEPIDKFKVWFETAGEQKIRKENAELKRVIENLQMELAVERSVKLVESKADTEQFEVEISGVKQPELMADDSQQKSPAEVPADLDAEELTKERTVEVQNLEVEADEATVEEITDQGIVDTRSALGL